MTSSVFAGLVFASIHGAVVLFVVYRVLFDDESDWPMYWTLPLFTSIPASLVGVWIARLFYQSDLSARFSKLALHRAMAEQPPIWRVNSLKVSSRKHSPFWSRLTDVHNFLLPLALFGVGGTLWWLLLPRVVVAAYQAIW
jgi:hypothetical protein